MEKNILFRTVIEVLGKPKEHVEKSMQGYLEKLKGNEKYVLVNEEVAEIKKQDEQELWTIFAELEVRTNSIENMVGFCFEYMPSLIEIMEPGELRFKDEEISTFLNDLQARLHQVDMVAKHLNMENDHLKKNMVLLLKNYLTVLLTKTSMASDQLSRLTGVSQEKIEDYLDQLIDEGKVDLKDGKYFRKE